MSAPNIQFGMSLELPKRTDSQPSSQPQSPTNPQSPGYIIPKRRFGSMRIPSFRSNSNDIETRISLTSNTSYDSNNSEIMSAASGRRSLPRRLSQRTSFPSIQETDDPIGQSVNQSENGVKSLPSQKRQSQPVLLPVLTQAGSEEEKDNDEVFEPMPA